MQKDVPVRRTSAPPRRTRSRSSIGDRPNRSVREMSSEECGRVDPVLQLTSHLTADRAFRDTHGYGQQPLSESAADQLVEQFLEETRVLPQTFRMDGLLHEIREIESQRFAQPPVPASYIKDQLSDDIWAQQYLEDGRRFEEAPDHTSIWAELAPDQHTDSELGLGEDWARDYVAQTEHGLEEGQEVKETAKQLVESVTDPKFQYSKVSCHVLHPIL